MSGESEKYKGPGGTFDNKMKWSRGKHRTLPVYDWNTTVEKWCSERVCNKLSDKFIPHKTEKPFNRKCHASALCWQEIIELLAGRQNISIAIYPNKSNSFICIRFPWNQGCGYQADLAKFPQHWWWANQFHGYQVGLEPFGLDVAQRFIFGSSDLNIWAGGTKKERKKKVFEDLISPENLKEEDL